MDRRNWKKALAKATLLLVACASGSESTPSLFADSVGNKLTPIVRIGAGEVVVPAPDKPAVESPELTVTLALVELQALPLGGKSSSDSEQQESELGLHSALPPATLTAEHLQALPVTARSWENFVLDGSVATVLPDGESRGSARTTNEPAEIIVDGADIRLAFGGTVADHARNRGNLLIGPGANEVAIQQVQLVGASVAASGSPVLGDRIEVVTHRGTNGLHGQGTFFGRQNAWGAQNPYTQWVHETAPATLIAIPVFAPQHYSPSDQEWSFGSGMGGDIRRDRLFLFATIEGSHRNDPAVSSVKHPDNFFAQPSNDQMQVLSARLGLNSADPVAAGVAAYSRMLETLDGLLGPAPRNSSRWSGTARIDWKGVERHSLMLEGTGVHINAPGGGLARASETFGNHSFGSSLTNEGWILGRWQAFVTPNLMIVTQGSVGRHIQSAPNETPSPYEQSLNLNAWDQLPQITIDSRYGFIIGKPARFGGGRYPDEHLYQASEQASWVHGALLVKAGFDVSHNTDATSLLRNQTGTYDYSSVENFVSDALAFASFGLNGQLDPLNQHNCDQTGRAWRDSTGTLRGLGYLPCYSSYTQMMGPANWWISTNDWAGYMTTQWQPSKRLVLSLAMRWDHQQLQQSLASLRNPDLPLTGETPGLGNNWGPRVSIAWGASESRLPVLRFGYGQYFARTPNATIQAAMTQTGSLKGDLNFFMRPTDNLNAGGAPPFPYVLSGLPTSVVKPGAVEFAPAFRNAEVHQAEASLEENLPSHLHLTCTLAVSLGRRLPVTLDANVDPRVNPQTITYAVVDATGKGPLKTPQITVPFYASWPDATTSTGISGRLNPNYQQVTEIFSRANSTYEAAIIRLSRSSRGLALDAHYTYGHAMDWNPNEGIQVSGSNLLDPTNFRQEYGTSNLDVRHSAITSVIVQPKWRRHDWVGSVANGWMLSGIGRFRSGLPFTMRTSGSLAKEFTASGIPIVALGTGMSGYGGESRVYSVGRNTYRYPAVWKADMRMGKRFNIGEKIHLDLLAESFNLFNHQNVTEIETIGYSIESGGVNGRLPTLNFLTGLKTGQTEFGQPLNINAVDSYRERQIQFGARVSF